MAGNDVIELTILEDGTIRAETDRISAANHLSADKFFRFLRGLCGGNSEAKRKQGHHHTQLEHHHTH